MVFIRVKVRERVNSKGLVSKVLCPYALGAKTLNETRNKRWWKRPWLVTRMAFTVFLLLTFHYLEHEQEEDNNQDRP